MKRKVYIKPDIKVIKLKSQTELLGGSHGGGGHETACEHGAHASFCD